jgi:hypothetical protein
LFVENGLEIMVAQSYSKNLGLYGERVGALNVVLNDANVSAAQQETLLTGAGTVQQQCSAHARLHVLKYGLTCCETDDLLVVSTVCLRCPYLQAAKAVLSQLKRLARALWSNPPTHGARIAAEVVGDASMFEEWKGEVRHAQPNACWHLDACMLHTAYLQQQHRSERTLLTVIDAYRIMQYRLQPCVLTKPPDMSCCCPAVYVCADGADGWAHCWCEVRAAGGT